nr:hypothetical protein [Tanacetum cinerariifolium]
MDTTIDQQVAMDEALVPHAQRLRIGRSNFHLLSNIKSKESTLQLVYDVMRLCPFFKAFLVTTDVPKIYMQEFWATATVHHHAIRSRWITRSISLIWNHSGTCYISVRGSMVNLLLNHRFKRNFLPSFVFLDTVEHKNSKKSNEMYYPRFTKVIIHHFMSKDPSIPRRNKVNWHYVRDDNMFSTIKLVSRHQNTQQFGALLPIELTNEEIKNSDAYKEYYVVATGAAPPKPKACVWKTRSSFDTIITPPTAAAGPRLTTSAKGKQAAKASKAKSLSALSEVAMTEAQLLKLATKRSLQQTYIFQASGSGADEGTGDDEGKDGDGDEEDDGEEGDGDDDDDDDLEVKRDDDKDDEKEGRVDEQESDEEESDEETRDEESFDPILKTPKNNDDEGNGEEDLGLNVGGEEGHVEEEEEDKLYRVSTLIKKGTPTSVAPLPMTAPTMTPSTIATITTTSQAPILPTTAPSTIIQDLPNFGSLFGFDNRLRTLEAKYSEFMQMNQFAGAVSAIPWIIQRYMNQRMNKAVKVAVQIQSDRLRDEAQKENDEFLKTVDENMQKIIKEWTSYVVAADLSEMELKKILIEKMEGNKETITLKRRRDDDANKDEEHPPLDQTGGPRDAEKERSLSQQALQRRKQPGALASQNKGPNLDWCRQASAEDQSIVQSSQHPEWFSQQQKPPTLDRDWNKTLPAINESIQPRIIAVTKLKIVEWHNYKHLDWITVQRDNDKLYKFKEGDFKRLRIQDIEDMLLFLVQGKLTNLTVKERFAFNVSLRMYTRSIVIQRLVEDLQLGVESYQKKLNLTKTDSYRSDLKRKEAYSSYSNPIGFIYQNKDKKNRLMRIDELHKFSDGTLTGVRTALDDHLKGIRIKYLPQSIWRKSDKDRAAAMI